ncbi:FAD/NAD(P)-binding protein [Arthrobacter roseus]|uniref:FAD/NAD(P)-binding protein n=1 Tax=Arthrobacter roseus TaxID=136274 RepID=UPI0019643E75|nr:FAD/NAD(P)-binding protein [Arthrobacter roseus]MBM7847633.1 putative NAD(P)/FAD-binding protein YdhS [Arthrobacter roseus]
MDRRRNLRVALVGAGPRGTSVLERLMTLWEGLPDAERPSLTIHIIDPYKPGAGHVWRPEQSRFFLMNTPALFPTVVPVGRTASHLTPGPITVSFDDWRKLMLREPEGNLSDGDHGELASLSSSAFPSRAIYGRYLEWVYHRLIERCGVGFSVEYHETEARHVEPIGPGYRVHLSNEGVLDVDDVVLALGHLPSRLNPEQEKLGDGAARAGLQYWPPNVPADVDWRRLPARKNVLVRGLGLNFFDIMIQLTEGRGGRFVASGQPAGRALTYEPSGNEPVVIAASRRGTPYRAKSDLSTYIPHSVTLRYCTFERAGQFLASGIHPGFDRDIWPLLHRDALWAYYSTLARVRELPAGFLSSLETALDVVEVSWQRRVEDVLTEFVPSDDHLDLEALAYPFKGRNFTSPDEFNQAVLKYLEDDAAGSAAGEDDPLKMAIGAMNAGRSVIKSTVADGGLAEASWLAELCGWFEPLVEGVASGPPALRIEQLAALVRAGVVQFVGPAPRFEVDLDDEQFVAESPWVAGSQHSARYVVDAMMPANRVEQNISELLRRLQEDGLVRPRIMMSDVDGVPVVTAGLDVTPPPYRPIKGTGEPARHLYVIGLQLSSAQWGTAIAAEAGAPAHAGSRTLRDADDIAAAILGLNPARSPLAGQVTPHRGDLAAKG